MYVLHLLQPCTEAVFMELFHEYRTILAPELVRLLASLQESQVSPDDLPAILKKDAIYNAVGLAAFDLYDDVCVMNYLSILYYTS